MIVETEITKYDRTNVEAEEFALFCLAVAGKNANQTALALERFLSRRLPEQGPFAFIREVDSLSGLRELLVEARLSPYGTRERGFRALASSGLNLRTCTPQDLEAIPGIGPKTARFFVMHSRAGQEHAILDTHILKWLREQGLTTAPKTTPTGHMYASWEQSYLARARGEARRRGITLADLDLMIWKHYAGRHDERCLCGGKNG